MKKGTDTERREGQQHQPNRARARGREFRSNVVYKKRESELLELSFDFLFPDSPCGLFCCDNFLWGDQSVNNLGIKVAGCLSQRGSLSRKALALH